MPIFSALILGIVEGVTEFLPISSTFHLIWTSRLLHLPSSEFQKLFEVVIQSGAILAVIALYAKTVWRNTALLKKTFVAFLPTAIVGFVLYRLIKDVFFENTLLQLSVFLIVGVIFILFEKSHGQKNLTRSLETLSYKEAFLVGLIQSLAVIPGISRAGAVLVPILFFKFRRDEAALFSFLVAVPTILAASAFDLLKSQPGSLNSNEALSLVIGFIAAFVTALIVVKWLIRYLQTHTLSAFGWYRITVALFLLLILHKIS